MKTWNNKINKHTNWEGDESTFGFPVSGDRIEEFVKESLLKKIGCIHKVNNQLTGFADEEDYETYLNDPTQTDLIIQSLPINIHLAYANKDTNGNIIDFSTLEQSQREYLGICINSLLYSPQDPDEYNWVNVKGVPGENGRDGRDGTNGIDGRDGSDGLPGLNGLNGKDGLPGGHFEFRYKNSSTQPEIPTNDGLSDGWTTIPLTLEENSYTWMSQTFFDLANNTYGEWSTPIRITGLDGKDGEDGSDGGHYEFRYKNSSTQPEKPVMTGLTNGWTSTPSNPQDNSFTWMSQSFVDSDNTVREWSTPIRITGENGKDGEDGSSIEFIYHTNNTGIVPAAPVTNLTDDWHGTSGGILWTDNPSGVLLNRRYEYISQRTKTNGVWGPYSTPVIWSKWGEKGLDGDKYEYIYLLSETNETPETPISELLEDYIPLNWSDEPGLVSEVLPYQWVCSRKKVQEIWGGFSVPVIWNKYAALGIPGGHYELRYKVSSTQPIKPAAGTDGTNNGWLRTPSNPDSSLEEYLWFSLCFVSDGVYGEWSNPVRISGKDGNDGLNGTNGLNGVDGLDGTSTYFHVAYANKDDNDNITDFSLSDPTNREYIGTYINNTQPDPDDPDLYTWMYVKGLRGQDGIPGQNGQDGQTQYLHIKYSNDGLTFTDNNGEIPGDWLGQYVDTNIEDSLNFSDYKWSYIKGTPGTNGRNGQNAPYEVITYGISIYSTANSSGPDDITEWLSVAPQRTVGTFIWKKIESYNGNDVLLNISYVCMTGDIGDQGSSGKNGKWYEYAGVWASDINLVTNTVNLGYYVRHNNNFYMNIAPDGTANNTTPGTDNTKWELMSANRSFYITKAIFGDYAEFGSAIINGDWMISRVGTSNSPSSSHLDFDSNHPNEISGNNFIPQYALDMRNGKIYMNDAELSGKVKANNGTIAGWNINSTQLASPVGANSRRIVLNSSDASITSHRTWTESASAELFPSQHISLASLDPDGLSTRTDGFVTNAIYTDGSGYLGFGAISWDNQGNIIASQTLINAVFSVLASGQTHIYDNSSVPTSYTITIKDDKIGIHGQIDDHIYECSLGTDAIKIINNERNSSAGTIIRENGITVTHTEFDFGSDVAVETTVSTSIDVNGITTEGSVTAGSFVKSGGTSSQVLMADGSVKTGYTGNVNLGNVTLQIEGGIITDVISTNPL